VATVTVSALTFDRQHLAHLGVLQAHHLGHPADVDLQRVDAQVGQLDTAGQPLGQTLGIEHTPLVLQPGAAQPHQRMQAGGAGAEALDHPLRIVLTTRPSSRSQPSSSSQSSRPRGRAEAAVAMTRGACGGGGTHAGRNLE